MVFFCLTCALKPCLWSVLAIVFLEIALLLVVGKLLWALTASMHTPVSTAWTRRLSEALESFLGLPAGFFTHLTRNLPLTRVIVPLDTPWLAAIARLDHLFEGANNVVLSI